MANIVLHLVLMAPLHRIAALQGSYLALMAPLHLLAARQESHLALVAPLRLIAANTFPTLAIVVSTWRYVLAAHWPGQLLC